MKKGKGLLTLLLAAMIMIPHSVPAYAGEAESFDVRDSDATEVTVVGSIEELAMESNAADNTAFFTIDASEGETAESLATELIQDEVDTILSGEGSDTGKQAAVAETLNDSGLYTAVEGEGSDVEVTSKFAYQRLRLDAAKEESINAYGAVSAVYYDGYYLLSYDSEEATMLAYEALCDEYGSDALMIDRPVKLSGSGWGTPYMGMDAETPVAGGGGTVTVAVCDSGIYKEHEAFRSRTIINPYNTFTGGSDVSDDNGHGTSVAGIIAESTPVNVRIMPIKVLDSKGNGSILNMFSGVEYAEKHGADIINLSVGAIFYEDKDVRDIAAMKRFDAVFKNHKALIVCASGNDGRNMDESKVYEVPGELESTLCVGAFRLDGGVSSFSNYGRAVDLAAPGESLLLPDKGSPGSYSIKKGTSFSSPYISAAAALIKAENRGMDKNGLRRALEYYAVDMGTAGKDVYFGAGCPVFGNLPRLVTPSVELLGSRSYVYSGNAVTPEAVVTFNGEPLTEGVDYTLSYSAGRTLPGRYYVSAIMKGDYTGSGYAAFDISKLSGSIDAKGKTAKLKRSKLRKKAQTLSAKKLLSVRNAIGKLSYKKVSGSSKLKINKTTGKVTVKKNTKKGKYKMKVRVTAAGDAIHASAYRTVTVTVRVK